MKLNGNSKKLGSSKAPKRAGDATSDKEKKNRALRRAAVVLGVIAAVILGVLVAYSIWEKPPQVIDNPGVYAPGDEGTASQPVGDEQEPVIEDEPVIDEEEPEEIIDEFEGALVTDRDDGVYTALIVGCDQASNSTDTIIVARFDTKSHTIDCVNIPRDTLINISWSSPKKINTVYAGYTNSGKDGMEGLLTHIRNLLGFDVDCYALVNLKAVEDIVDTIGGIYFDVPQAMIYNDPAQDFHVNLMPGYQLLNGDETLDVFRFRHGYKGGDLQRIGVQQDLLKAIASQLLSLGNIPNLAEIIQIMVENFNTNLDASNMAFFARQFLKCSMDDISFHTLPYSTGCLINGVSYISIDIQQWLELVNLYLNPYTEDITIGNVNILTSNSDGTYLNSTTGVVAGGNASFFCYSCGRSHLPEACPEEQSEAGE